MKASAHAHCQKLVAQLWFSWRLNSQDDGLNKAIRKLPQAFKLHAIPARRRIGGILAFWRDDRFRLDVVHVGRQAFAAAITEEDNKPWIFVGAYASTDRIERRELWKSLGKLNSIGLPVCFIGDYYVLLSASEKRGSPFTGDQDVQEFRDFLIRNGLMDMGHVGPSFTWANMQSCERMDMLGNNLYALTPNVVNSGTPSRPS